MLADLTHRFNSDWRVNVAATYVYESSLTSALDATGAVDPVSSMGPMRNAWNYDKSAEHIGFDANVNGRFTVLGMAQDLMVGVSMCCLASKDREKWCPPTISAKSQSDTFYVEDCFRLRAVPQSAQHKNALGRSENSLLGMLTFTTANFERRLAAHRHFDSTANCGCRNSALSSLRTVHICDNGG